jgi:hypothetical protein
VGEREVKEEWIIHMAVKIDLKDKVFGGWTVIEEAPKRVGDNRIRWVCKCICGKRATIVSYSLRHGMSKSCGCIKNIKVNISEDPLYRRWENIKARCNNPKATGYKNYGGKGIRICKRWLKSFKNFYEDMGKDYKDGLQVDRIDNEGDYSPENCRWVTRTQNQMNKGPLSNASSSYKGVVWDKRADKWLSKFKKNGKVYCLGTFTFEKDAALAYNKKALELNGEYAYLNKVN